MLFPRISGEVDVVPQHFIPPIWQTAGFSAVLVLTVMLVSDAHGSHSTQHKSNPSSTTQILQQPPYELAYGYLSRLEALNGPLGSTYEMFSRIRHEQGPDLFFNINYILRFPDGTLRQVKITSFDALEKLIETVREQLKKYSLAIQFRSKHSLNGTYFASVSSACPDGWFSSGSVEIGPAGPVYQLSQGDKTFLGAAVDDTFMITFPNGMFPPLEGVIEGGELNFIDQTTDCKVSLRPNH